ncbi:MAG: phytoene desaturase family protein [Patescibacteria group bacterium]|nr:phytoene desaturase family protein [Patescibacteria group bacterium]
MNKKVTVIGGGLGGLAIANLLARDGFDVYLFEKNENLGGRANFFREKGYFFDTGPSWILMDDIFSDYFKLLDKNFYEEFNLIKLDPTFKVFFEDGDIIEIHSEIEKNRDIFEKLEKGSFDKFLNYIDYLEKAYFLIKEKFILEEINFKNFFNISFLRLFSKSNPFSSLDKELRRKFKNEKIIKLLEFNSLFLGTNPQESPSILSIVNFFIYKRGVYYIYGGVYKLIEKLKSYSENLGVKLFTENEVKEIVIKNGKAVGILLKDEEYIKSDIVISNADLYHTEINLIKNNKYRTYSEKYWDKLKLAPSAFIIYLALDKKVNNLTHHNFYFSQDWQLNFKEIFENNKLPSNPSFYFSVASKIDGSIVPEGCDQLFILVPIASNLKITEKEKMEFKEKIYGILRDKLMLGNFQNNIQLEKFFTPDDFLYKYNSFKGTALGALHNLFQTIFRPKNKSKKVKNLYYVGSYVNPGIGMPMVISSAIITYKKITQDLMTKKI